jgi:hypothetical protein
MRSAHQQATDWTGVTNGESFFPPSSAEESTDQKRPTYQRTGNTPVGYLRAGIRHEDILLGDGFLERGSACLLAGPSGIGHIDQMCGSAVDIFRICQDRVKTGH